jgi:hypothetical protein
MQGAESRNQKFEFALERLQAISRRYSAIERELKADDTINCDRFILVAVMNMDLIGPRLHFVFVRCTATCSHAGSKANHLDLKTPQISNAAVVVEWKHVQAASHLSTSKRRNYEAGVSLSNGTSTSGSKICINARDARTGWRVKWAALTLSACFVWSPHKWHFSNHDAFK